MAAGPAAVATEALLRWVVLGEGIKMGVDLGVTTVY